MNFPTYDNAKFHQFLTVFFWIGALLNGMLGYFTGNLNSWFNAVLLTVLSFCTYRLSKLYKQKTI